MAEEAETAPTVMADIDAAGQQREARVPAAGLAVEAEPSSAMRHRCAGDRWGGRASRPADTVFANAASGPGYGSPTGQIENVDLALFERALRLTGVRHHAGGGAAHGAPARSPPRSRRCTSPLPGHSYHAGKAAVAHLVKLVAAELGPFNVRVNGIAPGLFVTNMAGGHARPGGPGEVRCHRAAASPPVRPGLFLGSAASSYVTGAVILTTAERRRSTERVRRAAAASPDPEDRGEPDPCLKAHGLVRGLDHRFSAAGSAQDVDVAGRQQEQAGEFVPLRPAGRPPAPPAADTRCCGRA